MPVNLGNPDEYTVKDFALLVRVRREGGREGGRDERGCPGL